MKKLFLTLVLTLTVSFAFANMNHISIHLSNKLPTIESFKQNLNKNSLSTIVEYKYIKDNWGVGCYANIYYDGVLVGTVYAYEYGSTRAEATSNCYSVVSAKARLLMAP